MSYKYKQYSTAHHILKLSSIVIAQIVTFDKRLLHKYVQNCNICNIGGMNKQLVRKISEAYMKRASGSDYGRLT